MLTKVSVAPALNLVHIATAYKVLAHLFTCQSQQQQQQQQQQLAMQQLAMQQQHELLMQQEQHGQSQLDHAAAVAAARAVPPEQALSHSLLLLDRLAAAQLAAAAAANSEGSGTELGAQNSWGQPSDGSSSSSIGSNSRPAAQGLEPMQAVRSLSMIVNSCAHMQYTPPWQLLCQLLEASLAAANEHQEQQQGLQVDGLGPQQQQQQEGGQALPEQQLSSSGTSNDATHFRSSYSGSSHVVVEHATCHALSLLCNGLSKLGFTCSSVYQPLSSSSSNNGMLEEQELKQRLQQQRQYWQRLAAVGSRVVQAGDPRDVSTLCYAFAAGGHKVGKHALCQESTGQGDVVSRCRPLVCGAGVQVRCASKVHRVS
jgi:hypothetical protein